MIAPRPGLASAVAPVADLERVADATTCKCGVWLATCVVPVGDGAVAACWLCAHDYVEHERALGSSAGTPCDCPKSEIYPPDVLARRAAAIA